MSLDRLSWGAALIFLYSIPLQAEDVYYGFSIGYGSLNVSALNVDTDAVASGLTAPEGLSLVGQPTVDFASHVADKDMNWNLFGGYSFGRYLSAEAGYMNFGKSITSSNLSAEITTTLPDLLMGTQTSDARLTTQVSTKTTGFHINGIARYPFMDKFGAYNFSIYGKVGGIWWDADSNISQTLMPFSLQTTTDSEAPGRELRSVRSESGENGINFLFGVGADYRITMDIGVRAEWSYFRGIDDRDIKTFSIGAFYLFWL